jgi:hypothetical protein
MLIKDALEAPRGRFTLQVFRKGLLVEDFVKNNLIVIGSKFTQAQLLGGVSAGNSVTTLGYGTNGSGPSATDTALTGAYTNAVNGVTFPTSNTVQFGFALGTTEANGIAISEFGLLTGAGILYARLTRSTPLNKASDISLTGSWLISF